MPSAAIISHLLNGWGPPNSLAPDDIGLLARPEHALEWFARPEGAPSLLARPEPALAYTARSEPGIALDARPDSGVSVT